MGAFGKIVQNYYKRNPGAALQEKPDFEDEDDGLLQMDQGESDDFGQLDRDSVLVERDRVSTAQTQHNDANDGEVHGTDGAGQRPGLGLGWELSTGIGNSP